MLRGSAHYHLVPAVVAAGSGAAAAAAVAADTDSVVGAVAVAGVVGAAADVAAGTDAAAVPVAAAGRVAAAAAAVAGSHRVDSGEIAVVLAEEKEEPVPAVCVDSLADVGLAPENAVVAVRTELEAAVVAAWVLAVAAALAAAGSLEQGRAVALTLARHQPSCQRDSLQLQC